MQNPIRRFSLPAQAAEALRNGIADAQWRNRLPSEAELCRELQVSRSTLRKALAQLSAEGLIASAGRGLHHNVLRAPKAAAGSRGRVIRILIPDAPETLGELHLMICDSLRAHAGRGGYLVEFEWHPRLFRLRTPSGLDPHLARLNALPGTGGWVVLGSNEIIQRWFSARRTPCVVIGPPCPGVEVACAWPDTRASARHAAGMFHSRGHLDVVYFSPKENSLGDCLGSAAFLEEASRLRLHARVVTYPNGRETLCRALDELLAERRPPTAFFHYSGYDCLTLLCHLQHSGRKVPRDASLMAGWAESFMAFTAPPITHYRIDGFATGRKIARMLIDQIERRAIAPHEAVILPEFIEGGTLGRRSPAES